jgi:hypothetical protein
MKLRIRDLSTRFAVALLTFTAGIGVTLLWIATRSPTVNAPQVLKVTDTRSDEEQSSLEGWKEVEVKSKLTVQLPEDMQTAELIGDSYSHREAYSNREINITIVYGEHPSCETASHLLERSTYKESIIEVDGKKAKLGIDRYYQPEPIQVHLCFLNSDHEGSRLSILAFCRDDSALKTVQRVFASIKFK